MTLTFRAADSEDAYDLAMVHTLSWQSAYWGIVPAYVLDNLSAIDRAERFAAELSASDGKHFFVAEGEGRVIGFALLQKNREASHPSTGEIVAFYLLPDEWRKGYGRQMMTFVLGELLRVGFHHVTLWVLEDNVRARSFYEACGFLPDGQTRDIKVGKWLVEMCYTRAL